MLENLPFIDFHTHKSIQSIPIDEIWVRNLIFNKDRLNPSTDKFKNLYLTFGIHPWYLSSINLQEFKKILNTLNNNPNFLGLGEIGLDRFILKNKSENLKESNWHQQLEYFEKQLDLAAEFKIKTIIIHNVKSFSDIYPFIKKHSDIMFIFHDFLGNNNQFQELNKLDNSYYSLGSIFTNRSKLNNLNTNLIDKTKIFLETDDTNKSIKEIYQLGFNKLKNIFLDLDELKITIYRNFQKIKNLS